MDKHYKPTELGQDYIDDDLEDSVLAATHGKQPFDAMYVLMQYFAFVDNYSVTPQQVHDEQAKLVSGMRAHGGSWDAETTSIHQNLVDNTLHLFECCVKCGLLVSN